MRVNKNSLLEKLKKERAVYYDIVEQSKYYVTVQPIENLEDVSDVFYTYENRYEIYVAQDTGLVEQWSFFATAEDQEPQFSLPWKNWQPFGDILLATSKGRDMDWEIVVSDDVPEGVFEVGQE